MSPSTSSNNPYKLKYDLKHTINLNERFVNISVVITWWIREILSMNFRKMLLSYPFKYVEEKIVRRYTYCISLISTNHVRRINA